MAKKSKKKQAAETQDNGLLGGRLNAIAVALLTALVTEIVQQVLDRLFSTHPQPSAAGADSNSDEADHDFLPSKADVDLDDTPVTAASAVVDRVAQAKPPVQDVLNTIRSTVEEATPRLNEAIAVLQSSSKDPKQAVATLARNALAGTKDTLDVAVASPKLDSWMTNALSVAESAIGNLSTDSDEEPKKKNRKKKGKKKGKKSKK